jgi:hypothetical protein
LGYAENLGGYWRGRYKLSPGKYTTVADADGTTIRFRTKAAAKKAADAEEAKLLAGTKKVTAGPITFGAYVNRWYAAQDLAASTMQNYRRHIEEHLLPAFEGQGIAEIQKMDISAWESVSARFPMQLPVSRLGGQRFIRSLPMRLMKGYVTLIRQPRGADAGSALAAHVIAARRRW